MNTEARSAFVAVKTENLKSLVLDKQIIALHVQNDISRFGSCPFDFETAISDIDLKILKAEKDLLLLIKEF